MEYTRRSMPHGNAFLTFSQTLATHPYLLLINIVHIGKKTAKDVESDAYMMGFRARTG